MGVEICWHHVGQQLLQGHEMIHMHIFHIQLINYHSPVVTHGA